MKDVSTKENIMLRVPAAIVDKIDEACGGRADGGRGKHGGRSGWILGHLHEHFGLPFDNKPGSQELPDLSGVDTRLLDPKTRLIIDLHIKGMNPAEIVAHLTKEKIPTSKGGAWTENYIRKTVTRIAKRIQTTLDRQESKPTPKGVRGIVVPPPARPKLPPPAAPPKKVK